VISRPLPTPLPTAQLDPLSCTPMEAERPQPTPAEDGAIRWESFYQHYRKPGYVPGYEILHKLGGGVFGIVFKARKESIGKDYAIKFLKVDDEVTRDAVARELASVRHFAQVDHPNLVSIEDRGEVDGIPYLIMGYAGQETLRSRLDAGRLDRGEALRIFVQAARGVQALHERSLVHFDLKPANIFLKGEVARVGDYGLSKLVTESRHSLSFGRGTPYYMAPEMLKRRGDARSDVYSLGVILFECLTGDVPFKGDSEWEVLRKHEEEHPQLPSDVREPERAVVLRCLAKDPEARFGSVQELIGALDFQAGAGTTAGLDGGPDDGARVPGAGAAEAGDASSEDGRAAAGGPMPEAPGGVVDGLFRVFELLVLGILGPVLLLSTGLGHLLAFLVRLPGRILGSAFAILGYTLIVWLVVMVVFGLLGLLRIVG
jgi:tRNA A-37 threonylcarbamoyl transferase component Bud32